MLTAAQLNCMHCSHMPASFCSLLPALAHACGVCGMHCRSLHIAGGAPRSQPARWPPGPRPHLPACPTRAAPQPRRARAARCRPAAGHAAAGVRPPGDRSLIRLLLRTHAGPAVAAATGGSAGSVCHCHTGAAASHMVHPSFQRGGFCIITNHAQIIAEVRHT